MPILAQPLVALGLHVLKELLERARDAAPRGVRLAIALALGVLDTFLGRHHDLPLLFGRRLQAHVGLELGGRVGPGGVLHLHCVEERLLRVLRPLVHLGRAEQRLQPAVEEAQRAVRHLELGRRRKLVVELLGARCLLALEALDARVDELGQPAEVGGLERLRELLLLERLAVLEVRGVPRHARRQLHRRGDHLRDALGGQELGHCPRGVVLVLGGDAQLLLVGSLLPLLLGDLLELLAARREGLLHRHLAARVRLLLGQLDVGVLHAARER